MKNLIAIIVTLFATVALMGCGSITRTQEQQIQNRSDVVQASDACARGTLAGYEIESNYYVEGESEQRKEQVRCK